MLFMKYRYVNDSNVNRINILWITFLFLNKDLKKSDPDIKNTNFKAIVALVNLI